MGEYTQNLTRTGKKDYISGIQKRTFSFTFKAAQSIQYFRNKYILNYSLYAYKNNETPDIFEFKFWKSAHQYPVEFF